MFPYMDSDTTPKTSQITAAARRVQALSADARRDLLFRLLGRMLVRDYEATLEEIRDAEAGR